MSSKHLSDADIITLFWHRDESAISQTAEKYGAYCQSVALHILQNIQDAEECVNDTYLKAWHTIPPEKPSKLGAYLAKITHHLALDKYRAYTAAKRGGLDYTISLHELEDCLPDPSADTTMCMDASEIGSVINAFLKEERSTARKIFVCRYFYGDSITQIAKRFGFSENQVKSSLYRTRNRLKKYLEKEGIYL